MVKLTGKLAQRVKEQAAKRAHVPITNECPDYTEECITKLGVYVCWDTPEHREYRCPMIDYREAEGQ